MNRITALAVGMVIGGAMLVGSGFMIVRGDITMLNSKNSHYVKKTYECKEDVTNLSVTESSGSVVVRKGDVDRISVTYSDREKDEDTMYAFHESQEELNIERKKEEGWHLFQIDFTDHKMTITVPQDFKGDLKINNSSGTVQLEDVDGKEIQIKNTSGSIKLNNVSSEGSLSVKNTSGSIKFTDVEAGTDMKAENTSGSIKLDALKAGGNISLETTSGSIKGEIVGKESDYRIRAKVSSGSCNLKDSDEGSKELNAHVSSGSIKITFTE